MHKIMKHSFFHFIQISCCDMAHINNNVVNDNNTLLTDLNQTHYDPDDPQCEPCSPSYDPDASQCESYGLSNDPDAPQCEPYSPSYDPDAPQCEPYGLSNDPDAPQCESYGLSNDPDALQCEPYGPSYDPDAPQCKHVVEVESKHCLICGQTFKPKYVVARLNCLHCFHFKCIKRMVSQFPTTKQPECPICLATFITLSTFSVE